MSNICVLGQGLYQIGAYERSFTRVSYNITQNHYTSLERLACHKHSGLFRGGEGGEEKEEECVTVTINQYVSIKV